MPGFGLAWAISLAASAGAPVRAASLDLCSDEYLLGVGRDAEIVSLSRLSSDPGDGRWWRRAQRFAANDGSVEGVIAARPNLVVTMGGGGRARADIARRIGIKVVDLPYPASPGEVAANLRTVAAALGAARRADRWVARIAALTPPARPRDAIFLQGGGLSLGPRSLGAQWMARAGLAQRLLPGGRATIEGLRLHPPAVLLLSDYRSAQVSAGRTWLDHPLLRAMPGRRIMTDGRGWTCGGPGLVGEIERLRAVLP